MTDDKQLDHLIGVLYGTALEPSRWREEVELMQAAFARVPKLELGNPVREAPASRLLIAPGSRYRVHAKANMWINPEYWRYSGARNHAGLEGLV